MGVSANPQPPGGAVIPLSQLATETPLSLEAAQEALILRHAHLSEGLPKAKQAADKASADLRALRAELEQLTRTLRAMTRIRSPHRRGVSK